MRSYIILEWARLDSFAAYQLVVEKTGPNAGCQFFARDRVRLPKPIMELVIQGRTGLFVGNGNPCDIETALRAAKHVRFLQSTLLDVTRQVTTGDFLTHASRPGGCSGSQGGKS